MGTRSMKLKLFTVSAVLLFIIPMITPTFGASQIESRASYYEIPILSRVQDAYTSGVGIQLEFTRTYSQDSQNTPYLGPLGRGWTHSYNLFLQEYSDGNVAFFGQGSFARHFQPKVNGAYLSSTGDYGVLTHGSDGSFQLIEKSGFLYKFSPSLTLNYAQDPNGNRVSCSYDQSNRLSSLKHSDGDSYRLEYNSFNRISKLIDNAGREIRYDYSSDGFYLAKVTDESNRVTSYNYIVGQSDSSNHRLSSITFPDGTHTFYTYNANGRLSSLSGAGGFGKQTFSYDKDGVTSITDAAGGITKFKVNTFGRPIEITSPDGGKTRYEYDSVFNPVKITDPLGQVFTYNYDALGNLISTIDPLNNGANMGYDPQSNKITWIRDSLGKTTSFSYNSQGKLLSISYPDGSIESNTYNRNNLLTGSLTADGKATSYMYGTRGELTALKNPLGYETKFAFTPAGDISSITDALGRITAYQHDISGNLIKTTFPDGTIEGYKYDTAGRLVDFTDRAGQSRSFSYDSNGFLQSEMYSSGKTLQLSYDKLGILSSVTQSGATNRLEAAYEHDMSNRLTLVKLPGITSSKSYDVSYEYDTIGNRKLMSYPDGYSLKYEYDTSNRLTKISDTNNALIASYTYDAAGRQTAKTLGNGIYTTYSFDDLNRLTKLSTYDPVGKIQSQFDYTRNSAGLLTSVKTLDGLTTYAYDDAYQLTSVKYPNSEVKYDFDAVGNRLSVETNLAITPYISNKLNQYIEVGKTHFEYDLNGNLKTQTLNGNKISYEWNENNQLIKITSNGIQTSYDYDYGGHLLSKIANGIERRYVWAGASLIAEMDSSGKLLTRYVYGSNINDVIKVSSNDVNSWPQLDEFGSIIGYTKDDGTLAGKLSYDVYGDIQSGNINKLQQRFEGMLWDPDSNLYFSQSRWYDASLGRFYSKEISPVSITHEYAYAENSPTNLLASLDLGTNAPGKITTDWDLMGSFYTTWAEHTSELMPNILKSRIAETFECWDYQTGYDLEGISDAFKTCNKVFTVLSYLGVAKSAYEFGQTWGAFRNGKANFGDVTHDFALMIGDAISVDKKLFWVSTALKAWDFGTYSLGLKIAPYWQAADDFFFSMRRKMFSSQQPFIQPIDSTIPTTKVNMRDFLELQLDKELYSALGPSSSVAPGPTFKPMPPPPSPPPPPPLNPSSGLGGVNFTAISLNYISVSTNSFNYVIKAQKTGDLTQNILLLNGTELSFASFLTGLALPESKFWVNLNPWEPDRIIEEDLGTTDVGRIMLEADLAMKRSFSSYENPGNGEMGVQFWDLLEQKKVELMNGIMQKHPSEIRDVDDVQFSPVTRHWIVPDRVEAYENDYEIKIISATLNINSEPVSEQSTYTLRDSLTVSDSAKQDLQAVAKEYGRYVKELQEQMILPLVVQDVNQGQNYSELRQIYISLALAQWYKSKGNSQPIFSDFVDSGNLQDLKSKTQWNAIDVYNEYKKSFEEGDYRYWKNSTYQQGDATVIESILYIGGGVDFSNIETTNLGSVPADLKELVSEAEYFSYAKDNAAYYFGDELLFSEDSNLVPDQPKIPESTNNPSDNYAVIVVVGAVLAVAALVILYGYSSIKKRGGESIDFDDLSYS
jgi:RHS repeat-associated protein